MSILFSPREVIEMAVRTERAGYAFYNKAMETVKDEELKETLRYLRNQEEVHQQTFEKLSKEVKELEVPYNWEEASLYIKAMTDSAFFSGEDKAIQRVRESKSEKEILKSAIDFEKETLLFFSELSRMMRPSDREVVEKIMQEEREHIRRLSALRFGGET